MTISITYGATENQDLLRLLPPSRRILDIGCGEGAWASSLYRLGADELVGVEPACDSANSASERYDHVVCQPVETVELETLGGTFDLIVAADVIEHLIDPWRELKRWRDWVNPRGHIAVSVPNLRDPRLVWRLVVRGDFRYSDEGGIMDRTHVRWFTASTLEQALTESRWRIVRRGGSYGPWRGQLDAATGYRMRGLLAHQLHVLASV